MLTSARPRPPTVHGAPAGVADWKWATEAPCAPPSTREDPTSSVSAVNLAAVDQPTMAAPTRAPVMLATAAQAMAVAASARAANGWAIGSTPNDLRPYSPNTIDIPPRAFARMSTSSDQPKRKATGRPQPSRRYT